jgi:hypothetical protein
MARFLSDAPDPGKASPAAPPRGTVNWWTVRESNPPAWLRKSRWMRIQARSGENAALDRRTVLTSFTRSRRACGGTEACTGCSRACRRIGACSRFRRPRRELLISCARRRARCRLTRQPPHARLRARYPFLAQKVAQGGSHLILGQFVAVCGQLLADLQGCCRPTELPQSSQAQIGLRYVRWRCLVIIRLGTVLRDVVTIRREASSCGRLREIGTLLGSACLYSGTGPWRVPLFRPPEPFADCHQLAQMCLRGAKLSLNVVNLGSGPTDHLV